MQKYDLVVIIGAMPSYNDKGLFEKTKNSKVALISMMEDYAFMNKLCFFSRYEAGSEEGMIAILVKEFLKEKELPQNVKRFFNELDEGYISAETNIGEEEIEDLHEMIKKANCPLVVLGRDLFLNKRVENIRKFITLLKMHSDIELLSYEKIEENIEVPEDIEELESFDGTVVFNYKSDQKTDILSGSKQFSVAAKIQDGQEITIKIDNKSENRKFVLNHELKGTIALMPMDTQSLSYRCKIAKITKREVQ